MQKLNKHGLPVLGPSNNKMNESKLKFCNVKGCDSLAGTDKLLKGMCEKCFFNYINEYDRETT